MNKLLILCCVVLALCARAAFAGIQPVSTDPITKFVNVQDDRFADLLAVQQALEAAGNNEPARAAILNSYQQRDSARALQSGTAMGQVEIVRQQAQKAAEERDAQVELNAKRSVTPPANK